MDDAEVTIEISPADVLFGALGRLLQTPRLEIADNFYDVGGDSQLAVRLAGQLRAAGWQLSVADILRAATLGNMAAQIRRAPEAVQEEPDTAASFPLAPIQLDALELRAKNPNLFNLSAIFGLPYGITPDEVDNGVRRVLETHEMLRVRIRQEDGEWRQKVMPPPSTGAAPVEGVSPADRAGVESIAAARQRGLSLADGKVCSFTTLVHDSGAWGLLVVVHHIATDAIGWDILVEDLGCAITAVRSGQDQVLRRSLPYSSWVTHLYSLANGSGALRAVETWTAWRSSAGHVDNGQRKEQPAVSRRETERKTHRHPVSDWAAFHSLNRRLGGEVLALSCLNYALHQNPFWGTGIVDTYSNARHSTMADHDFSRTVGWFSVKAPTVIDVRGAVSPNDFLERTVAASSALSEFRTMYGVLRYYSPDQGLRQRIIDESATEVCLNYGGAALEAGEAAAALLELDFPLGATSGTDERVMYSLRVSCEVETSGLVTRWRYPSRSASSAIAAIDRFSVALTALLDDERRRLG